MPPVWRSLSGFSRVLSRVPACGQAVRRTAAGPIAASQRHVARISHGDIQP
jgi:hypothetical protein